MRLIHTELNVIRQLISFLVTVMIFFAIVYIPLQLNIDELTAYENSPTIANNFGFVDAIGLVSTWVVGIILVNFFSIFLNLLRKIYFMPNMKVSIKVFDIKKA